MVCKYMLKYNFIFYSKNKVIVVFYIKSRVLVIFNFCLIEYKLCEF